MLNEGPIASSFAVTSTTYFQRSNVDSAQSLLLTRANDKCSKEGLAFEDVMPQEINTPSVILTAGLDHNGKRKNNVTTFVIAIVFVPLLYPYLGDRDMAGAPCGNS